MDVEIRRLGPEDARVLDRVAVDVFDEPDNHPANGLYRSLGAQPIPIVMFEYDL